MRILLIILLFPFAVAAQTLNRGNNFINVTTYAKGDGVTDDKTAIQNAINAVGNTTNGVYFPKGTYISSGQITISNPNVKLLLHPEAVIKLTSISTNVRLFSIRSSNVEIEGGTLQGAWDTTQYNVAGNGRINGQFVVAVENGRYRDITLKNVTITQSGDIAFRTSGTGGNQVDYVTLENCKFLANYGHIAIIDTASNYTIKNSYFRKTARPPSGSYGQSFGANAITVQGRIDNLTMTDNDFQETGRMAVEIWNDFSTQVALGARSTNINIERNNFGFSAYRTISILYASSLIFNRNNIYDSLSYVEISGKDVQYIGNKHYRGGFQIPNAFPESDAKKEAASGWVINYNFFYNQRQGSPAFHILNASNITAEYNTFEWDSLYTPVVSNNTIDIKNTVTVQHSFRVKIKNNKFRYRRGHVIKSGIINWVNNQECDLVDNDYSLDSSVSFDFAGTQFVYFSNCDRNRVERNRVDSKKKATWGRIVWDFTGQLSILKKRTWNGSGYDETDLLSNGLLNDPPASPATNAEYLTGDSPTGAWAGQPRKFAKWNGSAWAFTTIKNFIWASSSNGYYVDYTPDSSAVGDAYALVTGFLNNTFKDNFFNANQNFTSTEPAYQFWATNSQGISYGNIWSNNDVKPTATRNRIWYDKYVPYAVDYKNSTTEVISSATSSETVVQPSDANYTITTGSGNITVIYYNALTADRTVTLPDPATNTGRIITITHGGSGLFNLNLSAAVWKNSSTSFTTISPDQSISIISDGSKYILRR